MAVTAKGSITFENALPETTAMALVAIHATALGIVPTL